MKPVAIFRYARTEGPGHFATYLSENGVPWTLVRLDENEPVPPSCKEFSGLGFMGGPMSANDEYPWTQPVLELMRSAVAEKIPVIGHCLGGQMLARAMGGVVSRNPVKEIGWIPVQVEDNATASDWFGAGVRGFTTFEWHGDTFTIPPGATRVLTGAHCPNQGYVIDARHLGLQCHVEMNSEMIENWCSIGGGEIDENFGRSPAVQDAASIRMKIPERIPELTNTASRLYRRWVRNLRA